MIALIPQHKYPFQSGLIECIAKEMMQSQIKISLQVLKLERCFIELEMIMRKKGQRYILYKLVDMKRQQNINHG